MSDKTALANKLAALIAKDAVFDDGARVISQAGIPPALVAVLREIDDTVLERELTFAIGDVTVVMDVAGRRLRGIRHISGDMPGMEDVLGEEISLEEPDVLKAAGAILAHICGGDRKVTVRSSTATLMAGGAQAGVSAIRLAELWNIDLDAKPAPPMDRFLAATRSTMIAHIRLMDGVETGHGGDVSTLQHILDDQVAGFRRRHRALYPRQDGPMMVLVDGAVDVNTLIGLVMIGPEMCIFSCAPDALPGLCSLWSSVAA